MNKNKKNKYLKPSSIEVGSTALPWPMTFTLTYDLNVQSPPSYGHDLLTRKSSKSTVTIGQSVPKIEWK